MKIVIEVFGFSHLDIRSVTVTKGEEVIFMSYFNQVVEAIGIATSMKQMFKKLGYEAIVRIETCVKDDE